ncbi:MAG: MBL fold metallo-hydrolase [Chromatiales bacterium]|jgi:alkyl sulfatase BDS1-like metallo-beta-lactamase superfamily hydrolase|nr:MBL fold metallo-hydrolase [Chromatiales bacterium]
MTRAESNPAHANTRDVHRAFKERLNFADQTDFENARRGLVEAVPHNGIVKNPKGSPVWDLTAYDFLSDEGDIDTVNPSLLRMARLNMNNGLFQVADRVYQIRGIDLANMTIIEGKTGLILVDCMTVAEVATAGLELYFRHRPRRPVRALFYTHSHVDHYGGAKGVLTQAAVDAGEARVFAPDGFIEAVGGENILAGNAMGRRAQFQFGPLLKPGPTGQVDAGLGKVTARGRVTLIAPTDLIKEAVEVHDIDGVKVEFHLAPGTEAPAEMHMFFPGLGVLNMAENATPLLHNFCPLRGSEVRDPRLWSYYLADAVERFGTRTEVLICQHHWPTWGREGVIDFLERQRDLYKYIHDQTVRMMNHGMRPAEIAEQLDLPPSLSDDWRMRGYYGTVSHNSKAVFQRYLSWYDGHPANLNPLPPRPAAHKYVDYMGGAESILSRAREDYENGEFRWVAQVLYHVLFADPDNQAARHLAADAFEQLGYQAESATWRNAYLYATQELRHGVIKLPPRPILSPDLLGAVDTSTLFDFIAVRLDAERAIGKRWRINWTLTDRDETVCQTLSNETLTQIVGKTATDADATITTTREMLVSLIVKKATVQDALDSDALTITGDAALVIDLFDLLDDFHLQFDIVTPGSELPDS